MARKTVVFDSNVWIAYFNVDDSTHDIAEKYFARHQDNLVVLTEYVLVEITTILKRQLGPKAASKIVAAILQTDNVKVLPSTGYSEETLKRFLAAEEKHLSFVDISLFVLSQTYEVVTFDKKLAAAIKQKTIR